MCNESNRLEQLIIALKDADSTVRANAATALGWLHDQSAVEPLIDALGDPDEG